MEAEVKTEEEEDGSRWNAAAQGEACQGLLLRAGRGASWMCTMWGSSATC